MRTSGLVALLTVMLVVVLRGNALVRAMPVERTLPVERLLRLTSFECRTLQNDGFSTDALRLYGAVGSRYLDGLTELSAGDLQHARVTLTTALEEEVNLIALIWLADAELSEAEPGSLAEQAIFPGSWNDDMRLSIARHFFGRAGLCAHVNQQATRSYLAIGEQFLPVGMETLLDLRLARAISEAYLVEQRLEEALPWLTLAAAANDSSLLRISRVLHQLGRQEEAIGYYERALLYYPDQTATRTWAAQAAIEAGKPAVALRFLAAAPDWRVLGAESLLLWAGLCAEEQDWTCAREQYQRVLELQPDNKDAVQGLETLPQN